MTQLLEKAISRVKSLSSQEQDEIAVIILEELEDEEKWNQSFMATQSELSELGSSVRMKIKEGKIKEGGFDGK